jgi:hypothetical protein
MSHGCATTRPTAGRLLRWQKGSQAHHLGRQYTQKWPATHTLRVASAASRMRAFYLKQPTAQPLPLLSPFFGYSWPGLPAAAAPPPATTNGLGKGSLSFILNPEEGRVVGGGGRGPGGSTSFFASASTFHHHRQHQPLSLAQPANNRAAPPARKRKTEAGQGIWVRHGHQ